LFYYSIIIELLACKDLYPATFSAKSMDPSFSGKMKLLDYLLAVTRKTTTDRFVLVSNYTETLDVFVEVCCFKSSLQCLNWTSNFSSAICVVIRLLDWMARCRSRIVAKLSTSLTIRRYLKH
jgi:hypothetical protein